MVAGEDSAYRMELAERHLEMAEEDFGLKRWPSCVSNAQVAVENAAKAILACFGPIPRTHDTAEWLQRLPAQDLPEDMRARIEEIVPVTKEYGLKKHIRTIYGDENRFLTPWTLFGEQDAQKGLEDARQCVKVATSVYENFFGSGA